MTRDQPVQLHRASICELRQQWHGQFVGDDGLLGFRPDRLLMEYGILCGDCINTVPRVLLTDAAMRADAQQVHLGIAAGMSIARVWVCRYSK